MRKNIYYDKTFNHYRIIFYSGNKTFSFATYKNEDEAKEVYEKIKKLIDEKGLEYAYENRKQFQVRHTPSHPSIYIGKGKIGKNLLYFVQFMKKVDKNKQKSYRFAYSKSYDEIVEIFNKIKESIEKNGFDYTYENKKMFQNRPHNDKEMRGISKIGNRYYLETTNKGEHFVYSNKELEKVKEVRDYFLEHGKEETIKRFMLDY